MRTYNPTYLLHSQMQKCTYDFLHSVFYFDSQNWESLFVWRLKVIWKSLCFGLR
ncbi:hypothetical protein CC958_002592 [Salmonella enterica subsp. enterica]|nr:hypothetical protein [Salmonella enterica]EDQ3948826.1 hypothetical protein [Salmonella enterica subsp. enterica]EDT6109702.1 hypothetical protein [Salmonella enterica subsp. enterica serovar 4,[5],12:i:-]HAH5465700.1 hypothetical protein [Escherichia coli]EDR9038974.1 hypothetical protein [Salmonella enterica subsp. enterica]